MLRRPRFSSSARFFAICPVLFVALLQAAPCSAPPTSTPATDYAPYATLGPGTEPPMTSTPLPANTGPNTPPLVGPIVAILTPPITTYGVKAVDPDGDALAYRWSISAGHCGVTSWTAEKANLYVWEHPHPGPSAIKCSDQTSHPGTITVKVEDGRGGEAERTIEGTLSQVGPVPQGAPQPPDPTKVPGLN